MAWKVGTCRIDPKPGRFIDEDVLHALSCPEPAKREHSIAALLGCVLETTEKGSFAVLILSLFWVRRSTEYTCSWLKISGLGSKLIARCVMGPAVS